MTTESCDIATSEDRNSLHHYCSQPSVSYQQGQKARVPQAWDKSPGLAPSNLSTDRIPLMKHIFRNRRFPLLLHVPKQKSRLPDTSLGKTFPVFLFPCHRLPLPWLPKLGFPSGAVAKNSPANAGDARDAGSIFVSKRSPGEGNGTPLQYFWMENPTNRGAGLVTVYGVTKESLRHTWAPHWLTSEIQSYLSYIQLTAYVSVNLLLHCHGSHDYYSSRLLLRWIIWLCFKGTFWNIHQLFYRNQSSVDCLCPRILWSTWIKDLCLAVSSNPKQYHQDLVPPNQDPHIERPRSASDQTSNSQQIPPLWQHPRCQGYFSFLLHNKKLSFVFSTDWVVLVACGELAFNKRNQRVNRFIKKPSHTLFTDLLEVFFRELFSADSKFTKLYWNTCIVLS